MATERTPSFPRRSAPPGPIQVAVVNDCVDTCQLWADILTFVFEDVTVHQQSNGLQFLQFTQQNAVDVLFLDDMMPAMTGVETLEVIRADGHPLFDIPVVMMTTSYRGRYEYLHRGADEVVQMPLQLRDVCHRLEMLLSRPVLLPDKKT